MEFNEILKTNNTRKKQQKVNNKEAKNYNIYICMYIIACEIVNMYKQAFAKNLTKNEIVCILILYNLSKNIYIHIVIKKQHFRGEDEQK